MQIKKHIARNSQREERQARLPGQAGLEIILEILFFSVIFLGMSFMVAEGEENPTPEDQSYDSIRRYGALENKISYLSYLGMLESIESAKEEIGERNKQGRKFYSYGRGKIQPFWLVCKHSLETNYDNSN